MKTIEDMTSIFDKTVVVNFFNVDMWYTIAYASDLYACRSGFQTSLYQKETVIKSSTCHLLMYCCF